MSFVEKKFQIKIAENPIFYKNGHNYFFRGIHGLRNI